MASLTRKQLLRDQPDDAADDDHDDHDDHDDDVGVHKHKALMMANFVTVGLVVLAVIYIFSWGTS